jgi:hypothetical protein
MIAAAGAAARWERARGASFDAIGRTAQVAGADAPPAAQASPWTTTALTPPPKQTAIATGAIAIAAETPVERISRPSQRSLEGRSETVRTDSGRTAEARRKPSRGTLQESMRSGQPPSP